MLRKTMLVLVLLAGLAAFAALVFEREWRHVPTMKDFERWEIAEKYHRVHWAMQGIWAAFQVTGDSWREEDQKVFGGCPIELITLVEDLKMSSSYSADDKLFGNAVMDEWESRCTHPHVGPRMEDLRLEAVADYKARSEPDQARYVDGVMIGIDAAFRKTGHRWSADRQTPFQNCNAAWPEVIGALTKAAATQDGHQFMPKLVFTAYAAACREAKAR